VMAHHNTPYVELGWLGQGKQTSGVASSCGGYPISSFFPVICRGTGIKGKMAKGAAIPNTVDDLLKLPGDCRDFLAMVSTRQIDDGDVFAFDGAHGAGGMGDPLDREPERVLEDVKNRIHSIEMAHKVYGVVIDLENVKVDQAGTKNRRLEILAERKEQSKVWGGQE